MPFDRAGGADHRRQATVGGPKVPLFQINRGTFRIVLGVQILEGEPDLVGRGVAGSLQPDLGPRQSGPEPSDGRVVVVVDLVLGSREIDGDELAVVLGTEVRPDLALEHLGPELGELLGTKARVVGGHRGGSRRFLVPPSVPPPTAACPIPG